MPATVDDPSLRNLKLGCDDIDTRTPSICERLADLQVGFYARVVQRDLTILKTTIIRRVRTLSYCDFVKPSASRARLIIRFWRSVSAPG